MDKIFNILLEYKGIFITISVLLIIYFAIKIFIRKIHNATRNFLGGMSVSEVGNLMKMAAEGASEPEEKTVFGATNLYLPKITNDFADFHNNEAISAIKIFINEFLKIRYLQDNKFDDSNTEPGLEELVMKEKTKSKISNVVIHNTAISNYCKTNEYATITYQTSVGYLANQDQKEERYKIEYTLKLKENGISEKIMICPNCGASIDSTGIEVCPYCNARILRDTRMSWKFTSITLS